MQQKKRIDWIDTCKGIAIMLVILGHCITRMGSTGIEGIINLLIYSFHMPLFFFISGMNLKLEYSFKEFLIKRIKGILFPAYIFVFILLTYKLFDTHGAYGKNFNAYHMFLMTNNSIVGEYWFLSALFIGEMFCFAILKSVKNTKLIIGVSLLSAFIGITEKIFFDLPLPFYMEVGAVSVFFIVMGYLYKKKTNNSQAKWKEIILVGILFLIGNLMQYLLKLGKVNFCSLEIRNIFSFVFNSFLGICLCINIAKKLGNKKVINYLGRNSLYVFGTHYLFLELCCKLDERIKSEVNIYVTSILFTIVITFLCYCFCKMMDRIKYK